MRSYLRFDEAVAGHSKPAVQIDEMIVLNWLSHSFLYTAIG